MGYREKVEGKGISSFTISQNGNPIFEKSRSKATLYIIIFTIIALFFSTIFIYHYYAGPEFQVCNTKSCIQSSVTLMNCMNESVDPCDDFYEFTCGMFETNYPPYSQTEENSWTTILELKIEHRVKKFLAQKNEKHEPDSVHKTRQFYNACLMAAKARVYKSYEPLWDLWLEVGLDANYLNDSAPFEFEKIFAKIFLNFNTNVLFGIGVYYDPRNSSSHSLLIINHNVESEKFEKRNNMQTEKMTVEKAIPVFTEYFKEMVDRSLNLNQMNVKKLSIEDLMNTTEELRHFQESLEKISENAYHYKNEIPEVFTLDQLQNLTDSAAYTIKFNWTLYLTEIFRDINPTVYEQLTSENSGSYELLIDNRDHMDDVFMLLSETPITVIKMAILTRMVAILEQHFPSGYVSSNYCYTLTNKLFGMVTGYAMVNTLDDTSKAALIEMTDNIKWALRKMISEVTWIDDMTKNATLRKIANTKTFIGYPENYSKILNNLFQDLNITDNHVENVISVLKYNVKSDYKYLIEDNDLENIEWVVLPGEVNAFNYNPINAFFMPAAILLSPLYHNGIEALNYGFTGSTIGHELSHNYDTTGRLYNELGNVVQWWSNKSSEEYMKRTGCIVDHYNGYTVVCNDEIHEVNGIQTLDENIADIIGLKEAYLAYWRYVDVHGLEPRLPGLERYSQDQLFFLGYANQYCYYDTSNSQFDKQSQHSPNEVRVRGVLSLLPEFAKAWSCPLGSQMNPNKTRCKFW